MKKLTPDEREALLLKLLRQLFRDEITEGTLLRTLRKQVLGMSQEEYAGLVGISRRTLSDIERDAGSPTLPVLNRVFRPFGLRAGLLPRNAAFMQKLLKSENS